MTSRMKWRFTGLLLCLGILPGAAAKLYHNSAKSPPKSNWQQTQAAYKPLVAKPGDYSMQVSLPKKTFRDEPIRVTCEFQNLTAKPVEIYYCGFSANHEISLVNEQGLEPPLTERGVYFKERFQNGQNRDQNLAKMVMPMTSCQESVDLRLCYDLKPGKYQVKVRYREWARVPGVTPKNNSMTIDMDSNTLSFEVEG